MFNQYIMGNLDIGAGHGNASVSEKAASPGDGYPAKKPGSCSLTVGDGYANATGKAETDC